MLMSQPHSCIGVDSSLLQDLVLYDAYYNDYLLYLTLRLPIAVTVETASRPCSATGDLPTEFIIYVEDAVQ